MPRSTSAPGSITVPTVDRVLKGRAAGRADTLHKIATAGRRVGDHARGLFDHRLVETASGMRLGFVLLKEKREVYRNFHAETARAVAARTDIRGTAEIVYAQSQSPKAFADILRALGARCDALAVIAVNDRRLDQVVETLKHDGAITSG